MICISSSLTDIRNDLSENPFFSKLNIFCRTRKKILKWQRIFEHFHVMDLNRTFLLLPHLLFSFQLPGPRIHFCAFLRGGGPWPVPQLAKQGEPFHWGCTLKSPGCGGSKLRRKGKGLTHKSSCRFPWSQGEVVSMDSVD